jgi:hypothetical protein
MMFFKPAYKVRAEKRCALERSRHRCSKFNDFRIDGCADLLTPPCSQIGRIDLDAVNDNEIRDGSSLT